jgi:hypothetical protein
LGAHFLFIDEATLPLPWSLAEGEYTRFEVALRRATRVDIPVSPMSLSEEEVDEEFERLLDEENPPAQKSIARSGT